MSVETWSRNAWNELYRSGHKTSKQEDIVRQRIDRCTKERIAEQYPICCEFWCGLYIQKDMRKLIKRITKINKAYSQPIFYCPECGKNLRSREATNKNPHNEPI